MTLNALLRATALVAILAAGTMTGAAAQTTTAAPQGMAGQDQGVRPGQPGMMSPGMMGQGMMGRGMMDEMPMMGMHGHMMKMLFAITDADADGALSFEEVTAIHQRIFASVDANKDGKVTAEELQAFMRE
jgi:hypothetical protein